MSVQQPRYLQDDLDEELSWRENTPRPAPSSSLALFGAILAVVAWVSLWGVASGSPAARVIVVVILYLFLIAAFAALVKRFGAN